jgi:hypothetical protein
MPGDGLLENVHIGDAERVRALTNQAGKGQVLMSTVVFVNQVRAFARSSITNVNPFRTKHTLNSIRCFWSAIKDRIELFYFIYLLGQGFST